MPKCYDQHMHTHFSPDSTAPLPEMARAAVEHGLDGITITDHYNPNYPDITFLTGKPIPAYFHAMKTLQSQMEGKLEVRCGLEMGVVLDETLSLSKEAASEYDYDFILLAAHNTDKLTFDGAARDPKITPEWLIDHYYRHVLACAQQFKAYDALAHLNVVDRYVSYIPDYSQFDELIDEILRTAIADGKGIEINTSSFRYGMKERTTPTLDILKRYRELGGEFVTVGSDAHKAKDVGASLDDGYALLEAAGFTHYALYTNHIPQLILLP